MSELTTKEVLFLSICSQLPITIVISLVLSQITTNFILAFTTIIFVVIPTGYIVMWFANQVKK